MSIDVYKGKPGAGKSYHGTLTAREALEKGRPVVTNLPLKADHEFWAEHIANGNLVLVKGRQDVEAHEHNHFGRWEGWKRYATPDHGLMRTVEGRADEAGTVGPLIICDEASGTLEWMQKNSKKNDEWSDFINFLRLHRHSRVDIVFLYQDYAQVQQDVKSLVERWHDFTNMTEIMGANTYRVRVYSKGFQINAKAAISEKTRPYRQEVYELYDSYSEGAGSGVKGKTKAIGLRRRLPVWLSPIGIAGAVAVLALPWVAWNGWKAVQKLTQSEEVLLAESQIDGPIIEEPMIDALAPPPAAPVLVEGFPPVEDLQGFDMDAAYIGGRRYDLAMLNRAYGITVSEASQCRLVLVQRVGSVAFNSQTYTCKRGF